MWWKMNKPKSDFTYYIANFCLAIEDQNLGRMSVTNDMENVLEYIKYWLEKEGKEMPSSIIYKDSEGMWDGVSYKDGKVEFYPIQTTVFHIASNEARD